MPANRVSRSGAVDADCAVLEAYLAQAARDARQPARYAAVSVEQLLGQPLSFPRDLFVRAGGTDEDVAAVPHAATLEASTMLHPWLDAMAAAVGPGITDAGDAFIYRDKGLEAPLPTRIPARISARVNTCTGTARPDALGGTG